MTVAPWARRARGFAARLAGAVLLAAAVTAVVEGVLAAQLVSQAIVREGVAQVVADAGAIGVQARGDDPWASTNAALRGLVSRPDVGAARVVDASGVVRASADDAAPAVSERTGPATLAPDQRAVTAQVIGSGRPATTLTPGQDGRLTIVVPLPLDTGNYALQEVLDARPAAQRAADLRRSLLLLLGAGALAVVPLTLALGGRRLIAAHRRAVEAAGTDDLTGLGNRRAMHEDLALAIEQAHAGGPSLTLALLHVTGLGLVNDAVGRRRGDALLVAVADVLRQADGPAAYRIGGDGFALILRNTAPDRVRAVLDDLRLRIAERAAPLNATAGTCVLDERCPDLETLLIGADAALFAADQAGVASSDRHGHRLDAALDRAAAAVRGLDAVPAFDRADPWDIRLLTGDLDPRDPE